MNWYNILKYDHYNKYNFNIATLIDITLKVPH
jgi:hypothetical protein